MKARVFVCLKHPSSPTKAGRSGVLPCDGHTMFFKIEECWWKRHSIPKEGLHLVVVRIVFGSPLLMVHMLLASYKSMTGPQGKELFVRRGLP